MNRVFAVVGLLIEPQIFGFSEIKLDFSYGSATQIYLKWASRFVQSGLNSLAYKAFGQVFLHVGLPQPYGCYIQIVTILSGCLSTMVPCFPLIYSSYLGIIPCWLSGLPLEWVFMDFFSRIFIVFVVLFLLSFFLFYENWKNRVFFRFQFFLQMSLTA